MGKRNKSKRVHSNLISVLATAKIAELKEKLEAACSFLQDTTARRESERQRLQRQIEVSDKLFEGLCRRAQTDVENIETELKAEVRSFDFVRKVAK
jgi:hypothetical protein